jgi:pyrimidine 5'-nucleotidase
LTLPSALPPPALTPSLTSALTETLNETLTSALPRRRAGGLRRVNTPAGRRRPGPLWLFDLDNTLHHASHAIFPFINREMTAFIERTLGVDTATANRLRVVYTRRYGATLLGLVRHHDIDAHAFLRDVHPTLDLASLVRTEHGLAQTLRQLPGRRIILTNGSERYARDVLAVLGIERLFERVVAVEHMRRGRRWHAKPDAPVLRRTLRQAGVHARDAVLVEDTNSHLKHYRRLGIRTIWMTGHLPQRPPTTGAADAIRGPTGALWPPRVSAGRPSYVDRRIRSIKVLRRAPLGKRPSHSRT